MVEVIQEIRRQPSYFNILKQTIKVKRRISSCKQSYDSMLTNDKTTGRNTLEKSKW